MRLLLHKRKAAPFFLSLEIPSSKELRLLKKDYPTTAKLFAGELDVFSKVDTQHLLTEASAFVSTNKLDLKMRTAKAIEVRFTNRDIVLGPATGIVGFELNGEWCGANVVESGCEITWYKGTKKQQLYVVSEKLLVDDGILLVHFRKGSCLFDFFSRLAEALSNFRQKTVWSFLES